MNTVKLLVNFKLLHTKSLKNSVELKVALAWVDFS
jgi:hypothetical protein